MLHAVFHEILVQVLKNNRKLTSTTDNLLLIQFARKLLFSELCKISGRKTIQGRDQKIFLLKCFKF